MVPQVKQNRIEQNRIEQRWFGLYVVYCNLLIGVMPPSKSPRLSPRQASFYAFNLMLFLSTICEMICDMCFYVYSDLCCQMACANKRYVFSVIGTATFATLFHVLFRRMQYHEHCICLQFASRLKSINSISTITVHTPLCSYLSLHLRATCLILPPLPMH